jgi:hypothetical protein
VARRTRRWWGAQQVYWVQSAVGIRVATVFVTPGSYPQWLLERILALRVRQDG